MRVFLFWERRLFALCEKALLLEGADSSGAHLEANFLAINNHRLGLKIWLPDFLGAAKREAHVVTVLLALTSDFAFLHITTTFFSFR